MENTVVESKKSTLAAISPAQLLAHWQGHRSLTRRVIEAFPEQEFFHHSIGGMRPFAEITMELIRMGAPIAEGAATRVWPSYEGKDTPSTKEEILRLWDEATEQINAFFPQITLERFQEVDIAFGMYENPVYSTVFYGIDNEIHHRGQGYVYLRSLGIEPPYFWERE